MEIVDPLADFVERKKAADDARAALLFRLLAIKGEKKQAVARWKAEAKQIHELLRVKATRIKPTKPEAVRKTG